MKEEGVTLITPEELFGVAAQMLQEGFDAEFTVTGNSMWPTFAHGRDQVVLRALNGKPVKKGDIILFCPQKGRYLLHRVVCLRGFVLRILRCLASAKRGKKY